MRTAADGESRFRVPSWPLFAIATTASPSVVAKRAFRSHRNIRGRHEAGRGFDLERMRSEPFSPDLQDLVQHVSNALPNGQTLDHALASCFISDASAGAQMTCAANATPTNDVPTPAVRMALGQRRSVRAASAPVACSAEVATTKPIA